MKKFMLILLTAVLGISACACAPESPKPTGTVDVPQTASPAPTPEVTPQPTPRPTVPEEFASKAEEAEFMLAWYKDELPGITYVPEYDPIGYPNIKAIYFDGADMGGKKTKIFAYIGFPKNASKDNPVPAVVLQHGGGGYAFPQWVTEWTRRGYAAIAVGNTGYKPIKEGITSFYSNTDWTHRLTSEEKEADDRQLIPDNNTTALNGQKDVTRQWMYHAVASCILANNLLRADERVDASRIGLTGISWGGVITSIAMGFDTRFAFYIPIYGCAYLDESKTWMKDYFTEETCEVWNATTRLDRVTSPILWLNWAEDTAFSINTNDKSYGDTASHAIFAMRKNMGHSHDLGWIPLESYRFADWVVNGGEKMTTIKVQPTAADGRNLSLQLDLPGDAKKVSAVLYYLTKPLEYSNSKLTEDFKAVNCTVDIDAATLNVTVPDEANTYFIQVSTRLGLQEYSTSSRLISFG